MDYLPLLIQERKYHALHSFTRRKKKSGKIFRNRKYWMAILGKYVGAETRKLKRGKSQNSFTAGQQKIIKSG